MNRRDFMLGMSVMMMVEGSSLANAHNSGPVIVSAGRRVDAPGATEPRFPPQNVDLVESRIVTLLTHDRPAAIVSSAACGADLLLLQASMKLEASGKLAGIKRYILLPSSVEDFRKSSVTDRPGDWGKIYDDVLPRSDVQVIQLPAGDEGYLQANLELLNKAESVAQERNAKKLAVVIWNGKSRGKDDVTGHFLDEAARRGFPTVTILTV